MEQKKQRWYVAVACLGLVMMVAMGIAPVRAGPTPGTALQEGGAEVITMPPLDVEALLAEDEVRAAAGLPPRFAHPFPVQLTPENAGIWEDTGDDRLLWRLRIVSPGALSLNLGFTRYLMPPGGQLLIYTPDHSTVRGPFTEADNEVHGQLWTPILLGDEIVIELSLPADKFNNLELELTSVNHGYTGFGTPQGIESGTCNRDVICPEGDPWRDEIRSVAVYQLNGIWTCTGALVNNTAQDLTPYFLTADHCGIDPGDASTLVVYWNYEQTYCRDIGSPDPGDGSLDQFQTGSIFRAGYGPSDFTLVELDDDPDEAFNVHWAGWDRRDMATDWAVAIHHPRTDEKRISFEYDPTSITDYLSDPPNPNGTHIRVEDWDLGTTEPGSSGSPLFNPEHRIVGQLTGGYAACGNDLPDWYGRFFLSWTGGGTPETRLSDWLDPIGSGVPWLPGRDRIEAPFVLDVAPATEDICAPEDATYTVTVTPAEPGYSDPVTLSASGEPTGTVVIFSTNPVIPTGTSVLTITNTGAAPAGSYDVDVVGMAATHTLTVTVGLNLYTGPADQPTLLSPPDGATDQPLQPTLEWSDVPSAGSYNLELDHSPLFGSPLITASALLDPNYTPGSPLEGGRCYWWRVQGDNACGTGDWAAPFHFATAALAVGFFDDMESGEGNWDHEAAQGFDNWAIVTDQSHSPTHAWHVPDDDDVTDSRLWNVIPVPVGGGSTLSFWHRYNFEDSYDGSVLEISTDGGGSWTDLGPYITANGYNGTISTCCSNPLGGRQAWVEDLTEWTQVEVDLSNFAGQNVQIRWRIGCDFSISDQGWYIDDVQITAPLPPNPPPTVSSITPDVGTPYAEIPVQIAGSGFIETPSAKLDGTWLLSVTQVSSSTLDAVVPAGMAAGVYTLTLYNGDCQEAVLPDAFTITAECVSPTVSLDSGSPVELGQPMAFTATVLTGTEPFSYSWDFGGPGYGVGLDTATPVYTYTEVGTFTVVVTAENACGSDQASTVVTVEGPCYAPFVDVTAASPVELGQPMFFTATLLTGTAPLSFTWDFGGPGYGVGLDTATPAYTYTDYGTFSVTVTVENPCGSDVASAVVEVFCEAPAAGFESDSPVLLGQPMAFTATVAGTGPFTYSWDFGDGVGSSAEANPVYTYTQAGVYTVTLGVQGSCGTDQVVATVVVGPAFFYYLPIVVKNFIP